MTAKQKAAREKFKAVVKEAAKLRKKNPKLTQAQAVKQAWAISYSKAGKGKKVAAIKIIEKGESKSAKPKATYQQVRSKKGTFKGLRKVAGSKVISGRTISLEKAKKIASEWHGGGLSALYQFASSGKILKDNYNRYINEINSDLSYPLNQTRKNELNQLLNYIITEYDRLYSGKKYGSKVGATDKSHKDTKSHNVNIRVISGMFENIDVPKNKMYVRIWKNAFIWAGSFNSSKLREYLKNNVGNWIEIDTKYLFNNQYNTTDGYRLYDAHIDAIKNDPREYKNFPDEDVAFLDWKGVKPIIVPIDKKKIGTYTLESYPELNYYRFSNARKTINFIFWNDLYYIFNGIGYKKSKRITGSYLGDSVPNEIKNKLHNYIKSEIASK